MLLLPNKERGYVPLDLQVLRALSFYPSQAHGAFIKFHFKPLKLKARKQNCNG